MRAGAFGRMPGPGGIEGYAEGAMSLAASYESVRFEDVHRPVLHLFDRPPSLALDIGAGTGRDAAALRAMGHDAIAVEPLPEFREIGRGMHADVPWADDALPDLPTFAGREGEFGILLLSAVWMHLDERERPEAMGVLARLLAPGGVLVMSLRHGPPPPGRTMHDVGMAETVALAESAGLVRTHASHRGDLLGRGSVGWSTLAFVPAGGG